MKDYAWKIKVADLLNNPGNTDTIRFENKFLKSEDISLWKEWIKWEIFLQWLNKDEVLLKIKNISFSINYKCDICLNDFNKSYNLKDLEEIRFVNPENIEIKDKIHDTLFPIDMKKQNIDLTELIEIIVKNQEPFVKKCEKCSLSKESVEEKNQDKNAYYKIDFWKLLKS